MCRHEDKNCPRCGAAFECKASDITRCQCYTVQLNDAERDFLARMYNDCLCAGCLATLITASKQAKENRV